MSDKEISPINQPTDKLNKITDFAAAFGIAYFGATSEIMILTGKIDKVFLMTAVAAISVGGLAKTLDNMWSKSAHKEHHKKT